MIYMMIYKHDDMYDIHDDIKFGYEVKRKFHLTSGKYFNQGLLHYSQQFASDTDYIFFTHAVMQKIQLND